MFSRNEIGDPFALPTRVHHPWTEMEEYQPAGGMWAITPSPQRSALMDAAEVLMANPDAFRAACVRASLEWPISTSVALTTPGLNKKAWLGHAACYLATGSTEDVTRLAWHRLDEDEQRSANVAADEAIVLWSRRGEF